MSMLYPKILMAWCPNRPPVLAKGERVETLTTVNGFNMEVASSRAVLAQATTALQTAF